MVDEEHSLLMLGDADPCAVEVGLWMVKRADANDIEVEDLEIYGMVWILSIHPKSLNKLQQAWHISEKELYVPVVGVRRYGSCISSVIARWFVKWPEMQVGWIRWAAGGYRGKDCIWVRF